MNSKLSLCSSITFVGVFIFFGKNYFSIYFQKQHCIVDGFRLSVLLIQKYSLVNFTDLLDCLILQVPALSTSLLSPIHSHVYIIILIFIIKFLLWQNSNSNFLFLCLFVFFLVAKVYKFQLAIMFCPLILPQELLTIYVYKC